jgi:EAL domain-containing protein (putative c-di-GMP-specific phosphodiesterase class I)/GGDEF domain-containing protein
MNTVLKSLKGVFASKKFAVHVLVLLLQVAIAIIVYSNPDKRMAATNLMVLPVLISGLIFDQWVGAFYGLLGAVLLGPAFSAGSTRLIPWHSSNWLLSSAVLAFTGGFSGYLKSRALRFSYKNASIMAVDPYTGIQDRESFFQRIDAGLRQGKKYSVALIEIKNKDRITSLLGYEVYNDLINKLLEILQSKLPENIPLYSLEIGILGISSGSDIEEFAANIIDFFEHPVESLGIPVVCELIIGIATGPQDGKTADELIKNALFALEESRKTIKPISYFSDVKQPEFFILPLICELNEALRNGQIHFQYQPIVNVKTKATETLEALLRWQHPKYGPIPPQDFIYSLESTSFINKLTYWVVEQNAAKFLELQTDGFNPSLAVNISVANLQRETFSNQIDRILQSNHFPADQLVFEITERGLLTDYKEILRNLEQLHEMGIQISIDDFGTGNTTIETISKVHIDFIKLDKVFFDRFSVNKINQKIVSSIISLSQNLDIRTIAEGIEEAETAEMLCKMGMDFIQGYFYAQPMDFEKIRSWLVKQPTAVPALPK